jgi:hypothetical protein
MLWAGTQEDNMIDDTTPIDDNMPVKPINNGPIMRQLANWHGGQYSASYSVLSSWNAGRNVPRYIVRQCVDELNLAARQTEMHMGKGAPEMRQLAHNLSIHAWL